MRIKKAEEFVQGAVTLTLTDTDEATFTRKLDAWHVRRNNFIEEKTTIGVHTGLSQSRKLKLLHEDKALEGVFEIFAATTCGMRQLHERGNEFPASRIFRTRGFTPE